MILRLPSIWCHAAAPSGLRTTRRESQLERPGIGLGTRNAPGSGDPRCREIAASDVTLGGGLLVERPLDIARQSEHAIRGRR